MPRRRTESGITIAEIVTVLVIVTVTAAILWPVFYRPHRPAYQTTCMSDEKQILLAMIGYTQDYDGRFPPVGYVMTGAGGAAARVEWAPRPELPETADYGAAKLAGTGVLGAFIKNPAIFRCPSVKKPKTALTYMYNDLAAEQSQSDFARVGQTVLVAEGEDMRPNFGHAVAADGEDPAAAMTLSSANGKTLFTSGATTEAALTRHGGEPYQGSNYGLADGHVRWFRPNAVFFPPRASATASHVDPRSKKATGPDPAGDMRWHRLEYKATFHIR